MQNNEKNNRNINEKNNRNNNEKNNDNTRKERSKNKQNNNITKDKSTYEKNYNRISHWFREKEVRYKSFCVIYRILPYLVAAAYILIVGVCGVDFIKKVSQLSSANNTSCIESIIKLDFLKNKAAEESFKILLKITVILAVAFVICTIARKLFNRKRPYEVMNIDPLIKKDKEGQSFPSRHMFSAGLISMAALYVNPVLGIAVFVISVIIGILRPIAGVHYVSDVVAGFAIGIVFGLLIFAI